MYEFKQAGGAPLRELCHSRDRLKDRRRTRSDRRVTGDGDTRHTLKIYMLEGKKAYEWLTSVMKGRLETVTTSRF